MEKIKKIHLDLTEKEYEILEKIKEENKFKTNIKALRYLINNYKKEKEMKEILGELIEEKLVDHKSYLDRVRWASQIAEKNTIILLDIINTILINGKIENLDGVITKKFAPAKLIEQSENYYKEEIAHYKQAKDSREAKKGK